jgi:hypothetical protein
MIVKISYPLWLPPWSLLHGGNRMPSLYDLESQSITGEPIRLSEFEGQLCLVVNVASR